MSWHGEIRERISQLEGVSEAGFVIRRTYTALLYELAFSAMQKSVCLIWNQEVGPRGSIPIVVGDFSGWVTILVSCL